MLLSEREPESGGTAGERSSPMQQGQPLWPISLPQERERERETYISEAIVPRSFALLDMGVGFHPALVIQQAEH